MRRMRYVLSENIKQMCGGMSFYVAIISAVILMMVGSVYFDMNTGKAISMVTLIIERDSQSIIDNGNISFYDIVLGGSKSYIWMFAPILTALPFVTMMCSGNTKSNIRFKISRVGKCNFIVGNILSGAIVGGLIMFISNLIYNIFTYIVLFHMHTGQVLQEGMIGHILIRLFCTFLYGCISTFMVLFFCAFIKNKYLIMTTPFVLNYIWNNSSVKILSVFFQNVKDGTITSGIYKSLVNQDNIGLLFLNSKIEIVVMIIMNLFFEMIIIGMNYAVMERRCDCGEE